MAFFETLLPASWRGVPFGVLGSSLKGGRRNAVHEYPYRDTPWIEDLGRKGRRITLSGFLVQNDITQFPAGLGSVATTIGEILSGPVVLQRQQMVQACEQKGPGTLVHPTLGRLQVSLDDYEVLEQWDDGPYFELRLVFLDPGARLFPSLGASTLDNVFAAASLLDSVAGAAFGTRANVALAQGAAVARIAMLGAVTFSDSAVSLGNDATNGFSLVGLLQPLTGTYGRYFGGGNSGAYASATDATPVSSTGLSAAVDGVLQAGAAARSAIASAGSALVSAGQNLGLSS